MLITFEGLDFSGKSTQIKLLADRLKQERHEVLVLREPGGTSIGEKIRTVLLDTKSTGMTAAAEFLLYSASRSQLVEHVMKPALASGTVVLCDRFYDSSTAYQGWGRELPLDIVKAINYLAGGGLVPDVTFFIDIPLHEVERRIAERGEGKDRIESGGHEFYEKVLKGYKSLMAEHKRFVVIDGMKSIEVIHDAIWKAVSAKLNKRVIH
ncbi:MAG: dTMP kinase [Ignavibacteriae bacterium]|nr:dTMP kinase [Ignavibacteriota bacterium]